LKKKIKTKIDLIIPEFPIRIEEISEKHPELNKSFKIDYLAFSKSEKRVFLIELKTDLLSRRDKQDWYLESAVKIKVKGMVEGLIKIYDATTQKVKYDNLLGKIEKIGWIKKDRKNIINLNIEIEPSVVYIQPLNNENESSIISFDDIIETLSDSNDSVTKRFIESLEKRKIDTNKKQNTVGNKL